LRRIVTERRAVVEHNPKLGTIMPARLLDAREPSCGIEAYQAGTDVERGMGDHFAGGADRNFRRAATDVDIHDNGLVTDRARDGARSMRRQHRFKTVAGADRNHLAGLPRKQVPDTARVAAA